jgi:hypothetical protein
LAIAPRVRSFGDVNARRVVALTPRPTLLRPVRSPAPSTK